MNRDLALYIEAQPHDIGVRIWLYLYGTSASNGSVMVNFRELATMYQETIPYIKKVFDYKTAAKRQMIVVNAETENSVVINFKLAGRPITKKATKRQIAKVVPPDRLKEEKPKKGKGKIQTDLPILLQSDSPLIQSKINVIDEIYTPTFSRILIADYSEFYKSIQANNAINAGIPLERINPVNPLITGRDIVCFKDITKYFIEIGCNNQDTVRRSFKKIYEHWDKLDQFCQNGFTPALIRFNLNKIYLTLKNLNLNQNHQPNDSTNKDLQAQIARTEGKDYSFLEKRNKEKQKQ